jgi:hypothetical protein
VLELNYGSPSHSWREDITLKYTSHFGGTQTDLAWIKLNIVPEDFTITRFTANQFVLASSPLRPNTSLLCSAKFLQHNSSALTTQKTQPLYCWCVFTVSLHSNGHGTDYIENNLSIVKSCLPRTRVYLIRCSEKGCITPLLCCCVRVLLINGYISGSTLLAWRKYAIILYYVWSSLLNIFLLDKNRSFFQKDFYFQLQL